MLDRQYVEERENNRDNDQRRWQSDERSRDNKWRFAELAVVILGVVAAIAIAVYGGGGNTTYNAPVYNGSTPIPAATMTGP